MRIIILPLILISLYACNNRNTGKATSTTTAEQQNTTAGTNLTVDTAALDARDQAGHDLAAGKAKYYFHGIALPAPALVKAAKEKFGIELVGMGCEIEQGQSLYNQAIDSMMYQKHKQTVAAYINAAHTTNPF